MDPDLQINPDTSLPALSPTQQHEANLLRALEISPHELAFLEKHLLNNDWIPNTADEEAINDAVFDFCESFHAVDRCKFPDRVGILNFLFRAFSDEEEYFEPYTYEDLQEARDRRLSRETARYHGVRSLIADLAFRKSGIRDDNPWRAAIERVCPQNLLPQ